MPSLFQWTTLDGERGEGNVVPTGSVFELILQKRKRDPLVRPHESHPEHEYAMQHLPATLGVLRMNGCRCRSFPILPTTIQEVYACQNDFFTLPDLSAFSNLIVLELTDGRLETLDQPLPPNLARLNVEYNALKTVRIPTWPPTLPTIYMRGNTPKILENVRTIDGYVREDAPFVPVVAITAQEAIGNPERTFLDVRPFPEQLQQDEAQHEPNNVGEIAAELAAGVVGALAHELLGLHMAPYQRPQAMPHVRPHVRPQENVYQNEQNVHDSGVQNSVRQNLDTIVHAYSAIPKLSEEILFFQINATKLKKRSLIQKLFSPKPASVIATEFRERLKSPYSMFGHTIYTIIERLWVFIQQMDRERKMTALERLEEECRDAARHCTNGFVVRMANVLVGLDDRIVLKLAPNQILQARVPLTMKKMREKGGWREGEEPWQWSRDCFNQTCKDLDECEVTEIRRRQEWLIPFLDGFEDIILENNCTISQVEPRWNEHGIVHEAWAIQKLKFSAKPDPEEKTDDEDSFYTDKKEEYGLRNRWTKIDDITPLLG